MYSAFGCACVLCTLSGQVVERPQLPSVISCKPHIMSLTTTEMPTFPKSAYDPHQSGPGANNEALTVSMQPKSSATMTTKLDEVEQQQNKAMRLRGGCLPCPVRIISFCRRKCGITHRLVPKGGCCVLLPLPCCCC
ncbi:hypothetical protein JB92DRAFT_691232 [Gautieria morchelliformis]|nr:hypothetical protein JB92DRAFT_691232 [Gautieria morchelliformis]